MRHKTCNSCRQYKPQTEYETEFGMICSACHDKRRAEGIENPARLQRAQTRLLLQQLRTHNIEHTHLPAFLSTGELALKFYQNIGAKISYLPRELREGDKVAIYLPANWVVAMSFATGRYVLKNHENKIIGTFAPIQPVLELRVPTHETT